MKPIRAASQLELAYCAGVIDSDGCITIKSRSTKRKGSLGRTYSASVFVRQVQDDAVNLLHALFGGTIRVHAPSTVGGRDLFHWEVSHSGAAQCCNRLLPFLRIKRAQADIVLEFDKHMKQHSLRRAITWFKWQPKDPVYTVAQAAILKGVKEDAVRQAIYNGTVPTKHCGRRVFISARFWDAYTPSQSRSLPPEYVALRETICAKIRRLNGPTRGVTTASRMLDSATELAMGVA